MKNLSLLLLAGSALLLASCNSGRVPGNTLSGTVVEGQEKTDDKGKTTLEYQAWKGGAGTIIASTPGSELVRTSLAADGKFSLDLPRPADAQLTLMASGSPTGAPSGCQGSVNVSDKQARGTQLMLSVDAAQDGVLLPMSLTRTTGTEGEFLTQSLTLGMLLYVDRDVTIKGTQTCTAAGNQISSDTDMNLRQGWNKVSLTTTADFQKKTSSLVVRNGGTLDNWVFTGAGIGHSVNTQSLKAFNLPFFR